MVTNLSTPAQKEVKKSSVLIINFTYCKLNLMEKIVNIDVWIKLCLNDLKGARILYEQKEFRNSYYLFQQATEKANKAFTLKFELANEKDILTMGHDIFKFNRRFAEKEIQKIENLFRESKVHSSEITKKYENLKKGLSELDSLRNKDLVNLSIKELDSLYKGAVSIQKPFVERNPEMGKSLQAFGFGGEILIGLLQLWLDKAFIKLSISVCGILTMQHNTSTRYPDNLKDPTIIYTLKLPIIKKQPLFMNLLEEVIHKMKDFSDEIRYKEISDKLLSNSKLAKVAKPVTASGTGKSI